MGVFWACCAVLGLSHEAIMHLAHRRCRRGFCEGGSWTFWQEDCRNSSKIAWKNEEEASPRAGLPPSEPNLNDGDDGAECGFCYSAMESSEAVVCELLLAEAQRLLAGATQQAATPQARPAPPARAIGQSAALAALADVRQAATTLGMQLLPLRSPTDLATLLVVSLLYPAGTPARATKMLAELLSRGVELPGEYELMQLLDRLEASSSWTAAL